MADDPSIVPIVIRARRVWADPDPPRPNARDVDIQCDLIVDTEDQGWFLLESMNAVELMDQILAWLPTVADAAPFALRSIDASPHARILWFRPWQDGWAVGSPYADAGPFLVHREELVAACNRFVDELRAEIASRWPS